MRELLKNLLSECEKCCLLFNENVALIADDCACELTDDQIEAIFVHLHDQHAHHVH